MLRKRILVISDSPILYSGLGRWCRELVLRLIPDHEVAIAGWHYDGRKHDYPVHIYPLEKLTTNTVRQLANIIEDFQPDIVLGLGDIDYFGDFVELKERFARSRAMSFMLYLTVDGNPLNPNWIPIAKTADKLFVCTEFAKKVLFSLDPSLKSEVVQLGYDPNVFGEANREQLRTANGFGLDKFIIVTNQQNTVRHNLNALIWAFADFLKEKPEADALLYMNTDIQDQAGPNLRYEARRAGIEDKIMFGKNNSVIAAIPDSEINGLYNLADVIVSPSCNEGFGLPILEAMSAGVIPIGTNYSSLVELCEKTGLLVPVGAFLTTNVGIRQAIISHSGLVKALGVAYDEFKEHKDTWTNRRQNCKDFAIRYTWSRTAKKIKDAIVKRESYPLALEQVSTGKIGIMTTWNEQCGIAGHVKKYVESLKSDKVVFACSIRSKLTIEVPDEDYVRRCWHRNFNDYTFLIEEIKKAGISVLHVHHEFSFYENVANFHKFLQEVKSLGIKTIITYHTVLNLNNLLVTHANVCDKVSVCFNDEVECLKDYDLEHVSNPIEWVENVDKETARAKLGLTSKHIYLSSGFWQEHKGYLQNVQILPELIKVFPDILFIIVGSHTPGHPYWEATNELIDRLKLRDHVLIVDKYVLKEELYDYLHAADVLVYNYFVKFQSASAAALTGLSAHRPVITTDSPMFSYIKNEAIKTKMGDLQRLSRAIKELFEDTAYAEILVNRADKLLKNITPEKIAEKYESIYAELKPIEIPLAVNPDILIGAPTYNDYDRIDKLLTSIEENTDTEGKTYQLVIVDDGSDNLRKLAGLRRVCRKHNVPLIEHEVNKGIPSAWNTLTNFDKTSKYVVLFNDDIQVRKDWLKAGLFMLDNNENIGGVGWPLIQINKDTGKPNDKYGLPDEATDIGVVGAAVGCSFMFLRSVYDKTLGFWEDLVSFYEEIDMGFQMKDKGYESVMLPYPALEHWGSQTFGSNQMLAVRDIDESLLSKSEYIKVLNHYKTNLAIDPANHQNLLLNNKAYRMDYARVLFSKRWKTQDMFINPQAEVHNRLFKDRPKRLIKWLNKELQVTEKDV